MLIATALFENNIGSRLVVFMVRSITDLHSISFIRLKKCTDRMIHRWSLRGACVCVCVFFPFILDIKFVGRTSRGHTGGIQRVFVHPAIFGT